MKKRKKTGRPRASMVPATVRGEVRGTRGYEVSGAWGRHTYREPRKRETRATPPYREQLSIAPCSCQSAFFAGRRERPFVRVA